MRNFPPGEGFVRGMAESDHSDGRTASKARRLFGAILQNRLIQFFVIGIALFLLDPARSSTGRIRVSRQEIASLQAAQARRLGTSELSSAQTAEAIAREVEDELLYREALRLGLDKSDPAVRQRMITKALFLAEDLGGTGRPVVESDLRAHFEAHRPRFRRPAEVRFVHVFVSEARRGEMPQIRARILELEAGSRALEHAPPLGDPFPLARDVPLTPFERIAGTFGSEFAAELSALDQAVWSEPIASNFGWHLVKIVERVNEAWPTYDEIRSAVVLDHQMERKQRGIREFIARASKRYAIEIEDTDLTAGELALGAEPRVDGLLGEED